MKTSCFEYHCHCPNKSQAHYKDRKSQSNLVQICPLISNHLQHISTFKCFHPDLQTIFSYRYNGLVIYLWQITLEPANKS